MQQSSAKKTEQTKNKYLAKLLSCRLRVFFLSMELPVQAYCSFISSPAESLFQRACYALKCSTAIKTENALDMSKLFEKELLYLRISG